ncbi:integrase, partial [Sphingobium yanoikuyae]
MALSALALSKAKPREKPYKLADGHGLYLLVTPQGGRYWRMNYRFDGKAKTMAMGVFPLITLAEAREKREDARKLLAAGSDPCAKRKEIEAQEAFEATTGFRIVAEEWLAKREREGLGDITIGKIKWLLEFAYPSLGDRKIGEITSMELLAVLRQVEGRGRHETARRLRSVCGRVFRYAIATG